MDHERILSRKNPPFAIKREIPAFHIIERYILALINLCAVFVKARS